MKMNSGRIDAPIDANEMKELLKVTKETIARGILKTKGSKAPFNIIDLWRMQKKHKTLGSSTKW